MATSWSHHSVGTGRALLSASDSEHSSVRRAQEAHVSERRWATLLGAVGGAVGAAVMLVTAQAVLRLEHSTLDVDALTGVAVQRILPTLATREDIVGVTVAIVVGAFLGGLMGRLTWRPVRALPRIVFLSILLPAVWLFTQAFVIGRLSHAGATGIPWVPFTVGALAYALCVASLSSIRRRRSRVTTEPA